MKQCRRRKGEYDTLRLDDLQMKRSRQRCPWISEAGLGSWGWPWAYRRVDHEKIDDIFSGGHFEDQNDRSPGYYFRVAFFASEKKLLFARRLVYPIGFHNACTILVSLGPLQA